MRRALGILFSLVFYPALGLYTLVATPVLALDVALRAPFCTHRDSMRRFRLRIATYGYGIIRGLARPAVRTIYEAAPRDPARAKIIVANHVAASDPFLIAFVPEEGVQVVNRWPFRLPIWGRFARWAGYLSIRELSPEAFEAQAAQLLAEGVSIVAFPEGTRAGAGPMGPFHGAMFRLALATRVPLVPMCIVGNERTPARGTLVLEPATVRIRCLPEIPWEAYRDMTPFQLKNHVRDLMQNEVNRMRAAA